MRIKGKITREIDTKRQITRFIFYLNDEYPITFTNELAIQLAGLFNVDTLEILNIVEKYLERVGRIDSDFKAVRYHDDVKLTNSFTKAFQRLLKELEQKGYIKDVQTKLVKVNPSLYPRHYISEGIVTCEVPVMLFKFTVNKNV